MDNVCNRCLFSIPFKVEMAEVQEYLAMDKFYVQCHSNRIPLHLVRVKDLMNENLIFLRV